MEVIEIPTLASLEEMLQNYVCPAQSRRLACLQKQNRWPHSHSICQLDVLVFSYGTISRLDNPMDCLEAANDDAADQAIKYAEKSEHKILKDYSYDELSKKKHSKDGHINQVFENNRQTSKLISRIRRARRLLYAGLISCCQHK